MIGLAGGRSAIARELAQMVDEETYLATPCSMRTDLPRYLVCTGFLAGRSIERLTQIESDDTWELNFLDVVRLCERIFDRNPYARVVVMGSHSGLEGSFDQAYAGAKAALHLYVETKRLQYPEQMLVALAPHIIWDTAMTERRVDLPDLQERAKQNRLGRWLSAREVAQEAHHLLYGASPALSGQIIRMRAS